MFSLTREAHEILIYDEQSLKPFHTFSSPYPVPSHCAAKKPNWCLSECSELHSSSTSFCASFCLLHVFVRSCVCLYRFTVTCWAVRVPSCHQCWHRLEWFVLFFHFDTVCMCARKWGKRQNHTYTLAFPPACTRCHACSRMGDLMSHCVDACV